MLELQDALTIVTEPAASHIYVPAGVAGLAKGKLVVVRGILTALRRAGS